MQRLAQMVKLWSKSKHVKLLSSLGPRTPTSGAAAFADIQQALASAPVLQPYHCNCCGSAFVPTQPYNYNCCCCRVAARVSLVAGNKAVASLPQSTTHF